MKHQDSTLRLPRIPQKQILLLLGWYSEGIHRGIAKYAHQEGWALDASRGHLFHPPKLDAYDGIICVLGMSNCIDRMVAKTGKPVVNIGYNRCKDIPTVAADHDKIAKMATDYFFQRGFKQMAFYMCSKSPGELGRMKAFRQQVLKGGGNFHLLDCRPTGGGAADSSEAIRHLRSLLRKAPRPLAAMAEYDDLALHVIKACRAESIGVPEQVAVLGVNDDPLRCPFAIVPLSSIDDDLEGIGYQAASILQALFINKSKTSDITWVAPIGITTRQSTDILAIPHEYVAQALKLIWQNYQKAFNLSNLMEEIPMSYRRLHEAFNKYVGRTMAEELRRRRTEHVIKALLESDAKLYEIAEASGFHDTNRMIKACRMETGMTPGEFRKQHHRKSG